MTNKVEVAAHGDREIVIMRCFEASRPLVFDAMSKAGMLKHWLHGPPGWSMTTVEVDLRPGGRYRWAWTHVDGREMGMGGIVLEVTPPERLVTTERFDDAWYPGEATNTMELTEADGITTMRLTITYESAHARDSVIAGPMARGLESSYERLDAYLAEHRWVP